MSPAEHKAKRRRYTPTPPPADPYEYRPGPRAPETPRSYEAGARETLQDAACGLAVVAVAVVAIVAVACLWLASL